MQTMIKWFVKGPIKRLNNFLFKNAKNSSDCERLTLSKILKEMFSLGFLLKDFLRISLISLMYRFIEILDLDRSINEKF